MNMISNLLSGMNTEQVLEPKISSFQPGQMFKGKIIKLYPNGMASLQAGKQKVVAQLEAPLDVRHQYWFQVQPGSGKVRLKVISTIPSQYGQDENTVRSLIDALSISDKSVKDDTIKFFLKEQLPLTKDLLEQSGAWLKEMHSLEKGHEAIKFMLQKQLPFSKETFHAILALFDENSVANSIENLKSHLQEVPLSNVGSKLLQLLQNVSQSSMDIEQMMLEDPAIKQSSLMNSSLLTNEFKRLVSQMGYNYENDMIQTFGQAKGEQNEGSRVSVKPLLIEFIKETHLEPLKADAQQLLNKITGIQLAGNENGPIGQQVVQIPLFFPEKTVDLTVQWNGRMKNNGELDPDYCRVVFYLELAALGETFVDMQVQNRIITISIMNENDKIKPMAQPLIPYLKEQLNMINYTLSNVQFRGFSQPSKKQHSPIYTKNTYSGVDLRI